MATATECPRGGDECPGAGCEREPIRVDEQVIDGRKALVYWHDDYTRYCIEYPDGSTEAHDHSPDGRVPTV